MARLAATVDLPTPPLPLPTAIRVRCGCDAVIAMRTSLDAGDRGCRIVKLAFEPRALGVAQARRVDDQGRDALVQPPRADAARLRMPFEFYQRVVLVCHRRAT